MATANDDDAIRSLKQAVCCSCNNLRVFVIGALFGAAVAWTTALASLYVASLSEPTTGVAEQVVICPTQRSNRFPPGCLNPSKRELSCQGHSGLRPCEIRSISHP